MIYVPPTLLQNVERMALWAYRRDLVGWACMACLAALFFPSGEQHSRLIFLLFVLPLAGLALFSPGRRVLTNSSVLWACGVYLLAMGFASLIEPDALPRDVWRQFRLSVLIFVFVLLIGSLVAGYPRFTKRFFFIVGIAVAASAAINIFLYFQYIAPVHFRSILDYRLKSSIGMPAYANATNLSATYAVFFMGMIATVVHGRLAPVPRALLALCAGIMLFAILLTQARSALLAVLVGLAVLLLQASPQIRRFGTWAAVVAVGLVAATPMAWEALLGRGSSHRFEVWTKFLALITERPLTGYGSFSPIGITTDGGAFLDQSHNLVLSAWFRGGIVSACAMGFVLCGGILWARRYSLWSGDVVPLCVIVTIAMAGMFDYQLLVTYPTWPWVTFWLPFGLCVGAEMATRKAQQGASDASASPGSHA